MSNAKIRGSSFPSLLSHMTPERSGQRQYFTCMFFDLTVTTLGMPRVHLFQIFSVSATVIVYDHEYVPLVVYTSRSFPRSWLIIGFVTRLTWRVSLVEQELLTLPEHLRPRPVFSGVRVTRSLVLCVCFVDRCLSFCLFSFGHCVVCSSSIYGFWLPLWYFQILLSKNSLKISKR